MSITPRRPINGEQDYHVVRQGSGPRGIICARVEVIGPPVQKIVNAVFARIHDPGDMISMNHDPGDPLLKQGVAEGNNIWFFSSLSNARFGASPGTNNLLVVWAVYPGSGPEERQSIPFQGVAAAQTECALRAGSGVQSGEG